MEKSFQKVSTYGEFIFKKTTYNNECFFCICVKFCMRRGWKGLVLLAI
jgi:hypothetical protein